MSAADASTSMAHARMRVALMRASMLWSHRNHLAHRMRGTRFAASDARCWSSQSHRLRAVRVDGVRDADQRRRRHAQHVDRRASIASIACVSTCRARKIRARCRIYASFFSTRIAQLARRRARRCRTRARRVRELMMHTRTTSRVAVNRHEHWVCGTRVSTWSNAAT